MDAGAGVFHSRAKRFDMAVPAKLRAKAKTGWCSVLTKNVSSSGALLIDSRGMPIGAELEIWLQMHELRSSIADIVCPAIVIRNEECQRDEFRVGVKFKSYRIRPVAEGVAQPGIAGGDRESVRLGRAKNQILTKGKENEKHS